MDPRDLRRSAGDLLAKGRYAQAEVLLRQLLLQAPRDGQLWVRHAEALRRLARVPDAVDSYRTAARMLADDGHLPRAIAALKLALELRTDDVDLIAELIQLEVKKSRVGSRRGELAAVLHDDAFPEGGRRATLQFAMPDLSQSAPRAVQLALPAAPLSLDADGTLVRGTLLEEPDPPQAPRTSTQQFAAVTVEWLAPEPAQPAAGPVVRRLSERQLAVQVSGGAQWLLINSDAPLEVRYVHASELPDPDRS